MLLSYVPTIIYNSS